MKDHFMKKIILPVFAGILLVHGARAAVQSLPFVDHFSYPQGNLYTVAPGIWDAGGSTGVEITVQTNAALSGPAGFADASGNGVRWTVTGTGRRNIVQFSSISSNNVGTEIYASFLINNITPPSEQKLVAYLENIAGSTVSSPQLGIFLNGSTLGIGKKTSSPSVITTLSSGVHLVVVRYTILDGNDQADLWVDPTNTSYSAASPPASLGSATGGSDPANITYFALNVTSSGSGTIYFDEVRISTNWPDVVPGTPPTPPPATNVVAITQVSMDPAGFVIQGVGGPSNGVFDVLASTDLTIPVDSWSSIGSFNFDADGNFSCTNPVPDGTDSEFFAVHVSSGFTNVPPFITSQPSDQIVQVGQGASFSVTADGTAPLRYQWHFNTNTVLTAGTNATYLISSVTSNDVGSYSVLVSNNFGAVTSILANLTLGEPITNGNFYVSPTGNDANDGSFAHPFYNLQKAIDLAQPGYTIYMRGGTYPYVNTINIRTNSGTALAPINILAYPGEHPYLDYSGQPIGDNSRGMHIYSNANYFVFKGLEIGHCGDNAVKLEGSYNTFDQCVFHDNQDTGLQIGFGHTTVNPGDWAAYNTIINCDSYYNYDNATHGGNADGFACKMHSGPGNVFIGCRAWYNSDDAWDLFETDYSVIISNCWAWKSGYLPSGVTQGNGNGFKMGGNGTGGDSKGTHYAYNCVAFGCKVNGFTQNSHKDGDVVVNCLGFSPGSSGYNYYFEGSLNTGKTNIFENDAGIPRSGTSGNYSFDNNPIQINNSWNLSVTVNSADYGDITEAAAGAPRQADGSLPTGFARLVAGSDLIDKGSTSAPYSNTYCGSAPDLGAFEYCP
jgi:hypothetical protein